MIYYFAIIFAFFSSLTNSRALFRFSCAFSAILFSFTYGYGYDWINYRDIYEGLNHRVSEGLPFEPGYYYIMRIFSFFNAPFQALHIATTLFIHFCTYKFCKQARNPNIAYFTALSFMGFFLYIEQVRQCLAIAIIMLFYKEFTEKKFRLSLIIVALASLFHISAIFSLLILFFDKRSQSKAFIFKYSLISTFSIFIIIFIFNNPEYISFLPFLQNKISLYGLVSNSLSNSMFVASSLIYIFLIILVWSCQLASRKSLINEGSTKKSLMAAIFIWQTKAAFFLQRLQYYAVPSLIFGMDPFVSSRNRFSLYKYIYIFIIFSISLMPLRFEIYRDSINNPLLVTDSMQQIRIKIMQRCSDLKSADPENFIIKQCN